jgi:hypothetical protein
MPAQEKLRKFASIRADLKEVILRLSLTVRQAF